MARYSKQVKHQNVKAALKNTVKVNESSHEIYPSEKK